MDFTFLIIFGGILIFYVGTLIYLANQQDLERLAPTAPGVPVLVDQQRGAVIRWMTYGVAALTFIMALLIFQIAAFSSSPELVQELGVEMPQVDQGAAIINFVLTLVACYVMIRIMTAEGLRNLIDRLSGAAGLYDPASNVHQVAVVLALAFLSITVGQLVLSGGVEGLASDIESNGISFGLVIFQAVLMIAIAFLGVGMMIRRDVPQTLQRLGLRIPTVADVVWGIGTGIGLYIVLLAMVLVWAAIVPMEQLEQQSAASDQIAQAFNTLPAAFLLSASAGISEEILFRGALQPIFGLGLTSLFFALIHMQYTLTPATLIIFVVAVGLGVLRRRQSTTAAIIAHFVYNFVQLALAILAIGGAQ